MIKRKGQIVPKSIIRAVEKKSQHLLKFGCDCEVINNKVYPLQDGFIFTIPDIKHVLKKKNQRTVKGFDCKAVSIDCERHSTKNTCYFLESGVSKTSFQEITYKM
tara:strand:+ start:395 stop:709 length:315 start_codon:yes stop_codon:yes gene_type:complete